MMRNFAILIACVVPWAAQALSIKHVERFTVLPTGLAVLSFEQEQQLSALLQRARSTCISPIDLVVVLEQVGSHQQPATGTRLLEAARSFLMGLGVSQRSIYTGQVTVEKVSSRQNGNLSAPVVDGAIEVELVCTPG